MIIEIGGREFVVSVVGKAVIGELDGITDGRRDILVARECSRWEKVDTVLHEIFHAILAPEKLQASTEEKYVTLLATGFMRVLRDNPEYNPRQINA